MREVYLKRIGPIGSGVPSPFSPAVIVSESPWGVRYYRPCRPDIIYLEDRENILIQENAE